LHIFKIKNKRTKNINYKVPHIQISAIYMFYIPFCRTFYAEFKYDISFLFWVYLDPHSGTFCQTYAPNKTQRFKSGFSICIWVRVWVWVFFKSLANFELDNLKYKKKNLIFGYGFEYKFRKTRKKSK